MNEKKYTPGPWEFSTDPNGWSYYIHQADGAPYTPEYSDVAGITLCGTVRGEREAIQQANARLIAAAPDLLEALEKAVERLECAGMLCVEERAAIAKAYGAKQ